MKYKYIIEKLDNPIEGHNYNVLLWLSPNGIHFAYCGVGKFCKDIDECADYIKQHDASVSPQKHKEPFELFLGCLGNGLTVCNKAVLDGSDYKKICHISNGGNIRWYVCEDDIPMDAVGRIKQEAYKMATAFWQRFESMPAIYQYGEIIDRINFATMLQFSADKRPLEEKLPDMRKYYYSIA